MAGSSRCEIEQISGAVMPVLVRCSCGKRYQVADRFRGNTLRCKACNKVLKISRVEEVSSEEQLDELEVVEPSPSLPPRRGNSSGSRQPSTASTSTGASALAVRIAGLLIFLATIGNCVYQYSAATGAQANQLDFMVTGVLPIPIVGLIGLYIAYIGEEPNPTHRRRNRIRGFWACGLGFALIVLGGLLTWLSVVIAPFVGGFAYIFTGLVIAGIGTIFFGGFSALTGRKLEKASISA